MKNVVITLET